MPAAPKQPGQVAQEVYWPHRGWDQEDLDSKGSWACVESAVRADERAKIWEALKPLREHLSSPFFEYSRSLLEQALGEAPHA